MSYRGWGVPIVAPAPSGPFDPSQLSDLVVWLRASDVAGGGATVTAWPNQGLGSDASGTGTVTGVDAATPAGGRAVQFGGGHFVLGALGMTSSPLIATAPSAFDLPPSNAVDGNTSTVWHSPSGLPVTFRVELRDGAVAATSYRLTPRAGYESTQAPTDWTFEGSNDATAWTVLDTRSAVTWPDANEQTFTFTNTATYLHYRWVFTGSTGGQYVSLSEVRVGDIINALTALPGEAWLVLKPTAANNGGHWGLSGGASSQDHYPYSGDIYDNFGRSDSRATITPPTAVLDRWSLYRAVATATERKFYESGSLQLTSTAGTLGWPESGAYEARLGKPVTNASTFTGQVAEFLLRRTVSTAQEATDIENYLRDQHGV